MSKTWPLIKLGDCLQKSTNWIVLDPQQEYKEVTVRLWGKGVTLRGIVTGAQISGSRRLQVQNNQFILSRIDARNGAFGLIPDELEDAIVSSDFPVFNINKRQLLPEYMHWLSKTKTFVESCRIVSEGSTNRVRLKEEKFLQITIPLPPLAEQQRIVERIESLAARIAEAQNLREESEVEVDMLLKAAMSDVFAKNIFITEKITKLATMANVQVDATAYSDDIYISLADIEPQTGRIIQKQTVEQANIRGKSVKFQKGDVLFSKLRPYLNKVVVSDFNGLGTTELVILKPDISKITQEFIVWYLRSPIVVDTLTKDSIGTKMPRANMKMFRELKIPIPSLDEQRRIVAYLDTIQAKIQAMRTLQDQTAAELNAMLPAILDRAFKGKI